MTVSEWVGLIGIGGLVLNAGFQWGLVWAAKVQHEREISRLEKDINACRTGWEQESNVMTARFDRIEALIINVDKTTTKLEERIRNMSV